MKRVHAIEITEILGKDDDDLYRLKFGEHPSVLVDSAFMEKHNPQVGGDYVVYEHGYSPGP